MAFVSETGDGINDANAFYSVEEIDAYHALRRNIEWAGKDKADKEGAIVNATDTIVGWNKQWRGDPADMHQSLPFPRSYADPITGIFGDAIMPPALLRATAELALISATKGPLVNRNIAPPSRGSLVRKKTDILESQWAPLSPSQMSAQPSFDWIDDILSPLVKDSGGIFLTVARA